MTKKPPIPTLPDLISKVVEYAQPVCNSDSVPVPVTVGDLLAHYDRAIEQLNAEFDSKEGTFGILERYRNTKWPDLKLQIGRVTVEELERGFDLTYVWSNMKDEQMWTQKLVDIVGAGFPIVRLLSPRRELKRTDLPPQQEPS